LLVRSEVFSNAIMLLCCSAYEMPATALFVL
jgi:hypothetical protein